MLWAHAAVSVLFCLSYVAGAFTDAESARLVVNSSAKDALFVILSVLAASHIRRFGWLTLLIALAYVVLVATEVLMLIRGDNASFTWLGAEVPGTSFLIGWLAIDVALIVLLVWMYHRAQVARYELGYLSPYGYVTLEALAEVLIKGEAEQVPAAEVARNVDRYLSRLPGRGRGGRGGRARIQLALTGLTFLPLLFGRAPFPGIGPEARLDFLKKRFVRDLSARRGGLLRLEPVRGAVQAMVRVASQMTYLGYYGDERSHASVDYKPFSRRPGSAEKLATVDRDRPGVSCLDPGASATAAANADVVVIGSGAAGSILAYRLAEAGRRVLVLERGPHVDPRDFVEDEVVDVPQALQRGRAAGGAGLPLPGAAGHVRRRQHGGQQRDLLRPAAGRARALGGAPAWTAPRSSGPRARSAGGCTSSRRRPTSTTRPARCSPRACERSGSRAA